MADLIFLALTSLFFAAAVLLLRGVGRL